MKQYSGGYACGNVAAVGALGGFWTPTRRCRLIELEIGSSNAALTVQLIRSSARGTSTANTSGDPEDGSNETSAVLLDRTYSVDPTTTGGALREAALDSVNGRRIITWEFHDYLLWIPAGGGLVLRNVVGAAAQPEVYWVWEE